MMVPLRVSTLDEACVCVVGLGLMGSSLAMALKGHTRDLTGVDLDPEACENAIAQGVVSRASSDVQLAKDADIVILAVHMQPLLTLIEALGGIMEPGTLLLDLGSVKTPVVAAMNRLPESIHAIAGHPMCGKSVHGLANAEAGLFDGQLFLWCKTTHTRPDGLAMLSQLVGAIGSRLVQMQQHHHDAIVAAVSGLPYALSAGLALTVGIHAERDPMYMTIAASGFRDTSRLASTEPTMMVNILMTNREAMLEAIAETEAYLRRLRDLVTGDDPAALHDYLQLAQEYRMQWEKGKFNR